MTSSGKTAKAKLTMWSLAVPIFFEQVLRSLMGTVNTFMLSRISDNASASVGVANQVINIFTMAATMLASGTAVVVNQNLGAGNEGTTRKVTANSISLGFIGGMIVGALLSAAAGLIMRGMGLEEMLVSDAVVYLRIVSLACGLQAVSTVISAHFRCRGKAQISMLVILLTNILNAAGSLLVLGGLFPVRNVAGIATIRLISETVGLVILVFLMQREDWAVRAKELISFDWKLIRQFLSLGFMSGMEGISYTTIQVLTTRYITMLPASNLSAKVYTQTINSYAWYPGNAFGQASQIIAGHMIGSGDREGAWNYVKRAWKYVVGCNAVFATLFWLFAPQIIGIFTDSAEIIAIARGLLMVDIITCLARSLNHTFSFGLRSAGYVFWPMIIANCSMWVFQAGLGYINTQLFGLGVIGIWIAASVDELFRGSVVTWMWLKKKWFNSRIA